MGDTRIGLLDFDSKIPNLALMKLSTHFKKQGKTVILNNFTASQVDKVYCSVVFRRNREKAKNLIGMFPNIEFGGTGWDLCTTLPPEVEAEKPDYNLYTLDVLLPRVNKGYGTKKSKIDKVQILLNSGIGFTTRGCPRRCSFCVVPEKEGAFKKVGNISDLLNPKSNVLIILDNNFCSDPEVLLKLKEIKERGLIVDICQGIDIRTMTDEIAKALSEIRTLRSLTYAWDQPESEQAVLRGISILKKHVKAWRHLCYMLVGYDSTFDQDMHRYQKLWENGIHPYVMIYNENEKVDLRLHHLARWINGRFHKKTCPSFNDYKPWAKVKDSYVPGLFSASSI